MPQLVTILSKNIKHLRTEANLTQDELAQKLKTSREVVTMYELGRNKPPIEVAVRLADVFKLDLDNLVKTDLTKNPPKLKTGKYLRGKDVLAITVDKDDRENVELVNQKAHAGYLKSYADTEWIGDLPKINFPGLSKSATYRAFEIAGDSMLPINSGDIVIGKYIEDLKNVNDGHTYIVVANDGIAYKRVYKIKEDLFMMLSDNRTHKPYVVDVHDILQIWGFAAHVTLNEPEIESLQKRSLDFLVTKMLEKQ
jgi:transcriptional regulator with XRE-family HTH domain